MRVFRLTRKKYYSILSGFGASVSGGRWNSKGVEIIYSAESRALAMAEVAVHLSVGNLPSDFLMSEIEIPKSITNKLLKLNDLPEGWENFPMNKTTQKIGDRFIYSKSACVLQVPSAVVRGDFNFLINPYHPDFEKIKLVQSVEFPFDSRLIR